MRYLLVVLSLLLLPLPAARADVSVGLIFNAPGISIGINVPAYPRLVRIPGYPVYYDPYMSANYFFYDGLYWVFYGDTWYASSWYNGPWYAVDIYQVPVFVLRIPVRYYRVPPPFFHGWHRDAPPRWGEHWGREWTERRGGWDRWDRKVVPAPAPLPSYQRNYSGDRYPSVEQQQRSISTERYRYQPREPVAREFYRRDQNQQREQSRQREQYQQRDQTQQRQQYQQRQPVQPQEQRQQREQYQQRDQTQQRQQYQQHQPVQPQEQRQQREQYQQRDQTQQRQQREQKGAQGDDRRGRRDDRDQDRQ